MAAVNQTRRLRGKRCVRYPRTYSFAYGRRQKFSEHSEHVLRIYPARTLPAALFVGNVENANDGGTKPFRASRDMTLRAERGRTVRKKK